MNAVADPARLLALAERMEAHTRFISALFDDVPRLRRQFADYDQMLARYTKRKRGDRTKLQGGQWLEEFAVALVKQRAHLLKLDVKLAVKLNVKLDGVPSSFERNKRARQEVAKAFDISPATLQDWCRGVQSRQRKKSIKDRTFRRRRRFPKTH